MILINISLYKTHEIHKQNIVTNKCFYLLGQTEAV